MKTESVGMMSMFNVGLLHSENIGLLHSSIVAGQRVEATGFGKNESVGRDRSTSVGKNDTTTVAETAKLSAKRIEFSGEEEIVLTCGASTIRLTPGELEVLSTLVKINA
jgi:type VI secretion system secreted protein VgrG